MQPSLSQDQKPVADPLHPNNCLVSHLKVRPLIQRDCQEKFLSRNFLQRSLISGSNTFKTIKSELDSSLLGSSKEFNRKFVKILKRQGSLSRLSSYQFGEDPLFENPYFLSSLRDLSLLSSFAINLSGSNYQAFEKSMETLLKNLSRLKNLAHFSIQLDSWRFENPKIQAKLFRNLLSLKKLKSLSLSFVSFSSFSKGEVLALIFYLSKMTQLSSLKISLKQSLRDDQQTSIIMDQLALLFSKLPQLTQIGLNFSGREMMIPRSSLLQIFQGLQTVKKLSNLSLDLAQASITPNLDKEILEECLLCLDPSSMRRLDLDISGNTSSGGFCRISKALQRFTLLNQLRLNFSGRENMKDSEMAELSQALKSLGSLSSLCLIFPYKAEAKEVIGNVASALKTLQNLQQLKLGLGEQISTEASEFQELFDSLVSLNSLRSLEIDFTSNQSVNHGVLESLSEASKKLTALKSLSLDFQYNENITNLDVETLCCAIQQLRGLSALALNFADILEIDKGAIESVARALRSLPSLWSVNLSFFQNCVEREGDDLSSLFSALKEIRNIQEVVLFISYSQKNKLMVEQLGRHKNLEYWWS